MVRAPIRHWRVSAVGLGIISLALLAVAADVSPPDIGTESRATVELDSATLERYVGYYQLDPQAVFEITLEGNQLFARLTGQTRAKIYPSGNDKFFYKIVNAQIAFQSGSGGTVTGLVLHQHGDDMPAPRIDASAAHKVENEFKARVQRDLPLPGSEAAARRLIDSIAADNPNYNEMSQALADATRRQQKQLQAMVSELGPVVSTQFVGVGNNGWDVYTIKHEHGVSHLRIMLDSNGIITGAWISPGL
jgi:hypothetical protein